MADIQKVNTSNTKAQILKAYRELVAELQKQTADNAALKRELEKKREVVSKAEKATEVAAPQSIALIRKALNDQLDELERSLAGEQQKFQELQAAIALEEKELENVYQIKKEAESLDALVLSHKQAKEKLEREMADRKAALEAEMADTKRKWQREQDEYDYKLKVQRRKESDEYAEKKAKQEKELAEQRTAFEKEVTEREKALATSEQELTDLREAAAQFETRLQEAVAAREQLVTERLTKEFEYQQKLQAKDLEAELQLAKQEINSLKANIKEQQELIASLTSRSDSATQQVKDIALKAIENAGTRMERPYYPERGASEEKGG